MWYNKQEILKSELCDRLIAYKDQLKTSLCLNLKLNK